MNKETDYCDYCTHIEVCKWYPYEGCEWLEKSVVYCKDCVKHNIDIGDFKDEKDEKNRFYWKDEACPLIPFRGKAKGHEFDYQFCAYGKEKG